MKVNIHQPHDKFFKSVMRDPHVACDLFKGYLLEEVKSQLILKPEGMELFNSSFVNKNHQAFEADVIYKVKTKAGGVAYIYALFEHLTNPDKLVSLRFREYLLQLVRQLKQQHPDEDLPIIIPILVYTGREAYPYSIDFFDLFGEQKTLAKQVWDQIIFIDVCRETEEKMRAHNWIGLVMFAYQRRMMMGVTQFAEDMVKLLQRTNDISSRGGRQVAQDVLLYILDGFQEGQAEIFENLAQEYLSGEIKGDAMTLAEQIQQRGIDIGFQDGLNQGIEKGIGQGIKQGEYKANVKFAKYLLSRGVIVKEIVEATGLTLDEIKSLQQELV